MCTTCSECCGVRDVVWHYFDDDDSVRNPWSDCYTVVCCAAQENDTTWVCW